MGGSAGDGAADTPVKGWGDFAALFLKLLAFLGIYKAGKNSAVAKQNKDSLERIDEDKKRDNEIEALTPDARRSRLNRWVRD
jgi:hypothetical protein